jgi:hypothetical protein
MHRTTIRNVLITATLLSWGLAAYAYEGGAVANGGSISGQVKFQGAPPAPKPLEVTKDKEVCGQHPIVDEELLVSSGGGLQNAVV